MEVSALMIFVVAGFAFLVSASSDPFIEAQDSSSMEEVPKTNVKRSNCYSRRCYYNSHCYQGYYCYRGYYCCKQTGEQRCSHHYHCSYGQICLNGKCQKRQCYYHNQCKQGYMCYYGICKAIPGYCTSQSSCSASQCCSKHHPQVGGLCRNLKNPGAWCPVKPDGYHCGCTSGYECKRYYGSYYWGKCTKKPKPACSSDNSCQKTHCCSGRRCKPRKKANEYCPLKGADLYHCGCIDGYQCKPAYVGNYWGKCQQIVPPTEEPGSGLGEIVS